MGSLLNVALLSVATVSAGYFLYGRLLARWFRLDDRTPTPAQTQRDEVDFLPIEPQSLVPQHFSAIAAAGPIVGPILAGQMFGWAPTLAWILFGSIFIGGVHDLGALVASIRHRACSIPEVVRVHIGRRAYLLFLAFVWICLVYIVVAFTDITAASFMGIQQLTQADETERLAGAAAAGPALKVEVKGAAIATSSMLYLILPIVMALLIKFARLTLGWATIVFVPLVGVAILAGPYFPLDVQTWCGWSDLETRRFWNLALLAYCFVASLVPAWLLLQPRGHLGGYFLYAALLAGGLGVALGGKGIKYPAFTGFTAANGQMLFPMLFITVACGACSGFHSMIASGTTSKQLRRESDAKVVGYGSMLLEALVAVVSLGCLMMLEPNDPNAHGSPNFIYAGGIGRFLELVGVPLAVGVAFGLMAFTTFVYDTLDVCTRLGRFILQEVFGWSGWTGRLVATTLTIAAPAPFLANLSLDGKGEIVQQWKVFWGLFGASNQLLAALTLLGVTVWMHRTRRAAWVWPVLGLPTAWMYVMSMWALGDFAAPLVRGGGGAIPWTAAALFALGLLLLAEAALALGRPDACPPPGAMRSAAPA